MEDTMQRGSKHNPDTIQKLKQYWNARHSMQSDTVVGDSRSPLTENDVIDFLQGLEDIDFIKFTREHISPRVKEIKK